jgi:cysteine sulfinate desulfinase/cysteine desulfurase-like protein
MGAALNPLLKSTVRSAYKFGRKTREMVAEAKEQVHDIVAEVHAEGDTVKSAATSAAEPPKV